MRVTPCTRAVSKHIGTWYVKVLVRRLLNSTLKPPTSGREVNSYTERAQDISESYQYIISTPIKL